MAKYTVKQRDELTKLARRFGVSTSSLLAANPGVSSIKPGVTLRIPTAAPTADPKSPWTPDLPQPDPKDPYVPPPTADPKSPWTPDLPQPDPKDPYVPPPVQPPYLPPVQPPYLPPVQQPYLPPVQQPPRPPVSAGSLAPPPVQPPYLPSRVPVGRGAQRQPLPPGVGQGAGIIPGTFGGQQADIFTQSVFPVINDRIQAYLDRIYKRYAPAARQAFAGIPALQERVGITGPIQPSQQRTQPIVSLTGAQPPAPRGDFYAETVRIANQLGVSPSEAASILQQQGASFAPPTIEPLPELDPITGFPVFEDGELGRHSSIIEWYLDNGLLPFSLYAEDVARFGWTDAELLAAGYIEDAWGNWIRVGMETGATEGVAGGGGGGGYYQRGGGGGGRGGGGAYSYPSYLQREQGAFPQSFVQRGQASVTPTGRTIRPARMGAVTWRI